MSAAAGVIDGSGGRNEVDMPLFEMEKSRRGRRRVFLRGQLPFLAGVVVVALAVDLMEPERLTSPPLVVAGALTALASLASFFIPWERLPATAMISIAATDIVAVALLRSELLPVLPSVGFLTVYPVLWLAYGYGVSGIVAAIVGTAFITSYPYFVRWQWPASVDEWISISVLPALIVGVALVVNLAARQLRRNRQRLMDTNVRLEKALRQARDNEILLRSVLDTVNAGVIAFDSDNRLTLVNARARDMAERVGFELEQPPYETKVAYRADRETPIPSDERIVARTLRGEDVTDEVSWIGEADAQIAVSSSSQRMRTESGETLGAVVITHDITELALALEVREEFLRTISHELRTPVTNISGYTELIQDDLPADRPHLGGYLEAVQRNADRLMDRIRELLAGSNSSEPLNVGLVDLDRLVDDAVETKRAQAEARGITIERIGAGPAPLPADGGRLLYAVQEIVGNALKFGPPSSAVTVEHRIEADRAVVSVSDAGPGVPDSEKGRIFDRFYRMPSARRQAVQGFGIGLSIVRDTVAAHGGRVLVTDSERGGCCVTIELPVHAPSS